MSKRIFNASLSDQAARLQNSMQSRDTRRRKEAERRQDRSRDDPYEQAASQAGLGPSSLGAALDASAAVANAAAIAGPQGQTCDLCKVTFYSEAEMRQHNEGPTHRKAVAKDQANRERDARLGAQSSAAAEAVAAAAWAEGRATAQKPTSYQPAPRAAAAGAKAPRPPPPPQAAMSKPGASHQDLLAAARRQAAPITINGWMPPGLGPSLATAPVPPPQTAPAPPAASPEDDGASTSGSLSQSQDSQGTLPESNLGLDDEAGSMVKLEPAVKLEPSVKQEPEVKLEPALHSPVKQEPGVAWARPQQAVKQELGDTTQPEQEAALAGLGSYGSDSES